VSPNPVLLVHGFASSFALNWQESGLSYLLEDAGREVIGVDLLGHGTAPKPHDPAAYADLGARVVDVLPDVPVDAVGFSMGARTLIEVVSAQPERFRLEYIGDDGKEHRPVMIHRAILGSLERFIGIIIEHFAGAFPLWLAPVQASVLPLSEKFLDYGREVAAKLRTAGLRVEVDESNEKLGAKIRGAQLQKVPYMLVVGEKEAASGAVAVRKRSGEQATLSMEDFVAEARRLIAARSLTL